MTDRLEAELRQGEWIAAEGDRVWGWSGPAGELRARRRAMFLVEAAGLGPGVSCLELGAGTGTFTELLAASGCTLTAVELSEATARLCRQRLNGRAEVVVGDVEAGAGLEGRSFDAVVGVGVLHHVDLGRCLARTVVPLLRRDGRFAFCEPNLANPQVWAQKRIGIVGRLRHELPHETAFLAAGLRRAFEASGLEVETCEAFDFLHPATPRPLIAVVRRLEPVLERSPLRAIAGSIRVAGRRA